MKKHIRIGKMHYKSVLNKQGLLPDYIRCPWLNLSGHWLAKAGFEVGEPITITVSKNKLVVKKIKTETNGTAKKERFEHAEKNKNLRNTMCEAKNIS
jgi:hypothetical protein